MKTGFHTFALSFFGLENCFRQKNFLQFNADKTFISFSCLLSVACAVARVGRVRDGRPERKFTKGAKDRFS